MKVMGGVGGAVGSLAPLWLVACDPIGGMQVHDQGSPFGGYSNLTPKALDGAARAGIQASGQISPHFL
jgi:hypothetical protein